MKTVHSYLPRLMEICEHTFIANCLDSNSIIVDLGANEGVFTEKIHSTFGCSIFAVEPVPQLFSKIQTNEKVRKFNYCIAGKNGPVFLYTPPDRCASICQHDSGNPDCSIVVEGVTFEYFLKSQTIKAIDLLKVDIEGAEIELFSSITIEHLRMLKQLTIEFHDFLWSDLHDQVESIKRRMINNGFFCISFSLNNGNVLFVKRELITNTMYFYLNLLKYTQGIKRIVKRKWLLNNH
jgi:FkbM family methyltransferase